MTLEIMVRNAKGEEISEWVEVVPQEENDVTDDIEEIIRQAGGVSSSGVWECVGVSFQQITGGPIISYRLAKEKSGSPSST